MIQRSFQKIFSILLIISLLIGSLEYIPNIIIVRSEASGFVVSGVSWGSLSTPSCVGPGSKDQMLTISLKYNGNDPVPGILALLYLPAGFEDSLSKTSTAQTIYNRLISKGDIITLTYWIDIDPSLTPGEYSAELQIYNYSNTSILISDLYLNISLRNIADIEVQNNLYYIYSGDNNLSIQLINNGSGAAYGVSVSISSQQLLIYSNKIFIGDLSAQNSTLINVSLYAPSSAVGNMIPINLVINYIDECGLSETKSLTVYTIVVDRPSTPQIMLTAYPTTLYAGMINNITISAINTGSSTVNNIKISFNIPQQLTLINGSSQWLINYLEPGESVNTTLVIMPLGLSSDRTLTQIYATVTYIDQYNIIRAFSTAILLTILQPNLSISVDITPNILISGAVNNVSINVMNTGSAPIYSVALSISFSQYVIVKGLEGVWRVGDLNVRESRSLNVSIMTPQSLVGKILATITISYIDPSGVFRTETKMLSLDVVSRGDVITLKISPQNLRYGFNIIELSLLNNDLGSIRNVMLSATSPQLVFVNFSGTWYIGDLAPREVKTLYIKVFVSSTISTTAQLTISVSYTDAAGSSQTRSWVYWFFVSQSSPMLTLSIYPTTLFPGENNVSINISNIGEDPVYNIVVSFNIQGALSENFDGKWFVGDLLPNESKRLVITLITSQTQTTVSIVATLNYLDVGGALRSETRSIGLIVSPTNIPNFKISIDPYIIVGGRVSKINISIVNIAPIRFDNVFVTISSAGGISFIGFDGRWLIGAIQPNETRSIALNVYTGPVNTRQIIGLSISITYLNPYTNNILTDTCTLSINVIPDISRQQIQIISSSNVLIAGSVNNISLRIINPNQYDVTGLVLTISPPSSGNIILMSSDVYTIDDISPESFVEVSVPIYLPSSVSSNTISLSVSATYFDGVAISTVSKNFVFLIAMPPNVVVTSYTVMPQTITPGGMFSVTLSLSNVGAGTAYNVSVSVRESRLYTPIMGQQIFVGDMSKGASTTISFSFRASNELANLVNMTNITTFTQRFNFTRTFTRTFNFTPPFTSNISRGFISPLEMPMTQIVIMISYSDNIGKSYISSITIPLTINISTTTRTETHTSILTILSSPIISIASAVAIVIVIVALYIFYRRRKR